MEEELWVVCYQTFQAEKPVLIKAFNDKIAALNFIKMTENKSDSGYFYIEIVPYQRGS